MSVSQAVKPARAGSPTPATTPTDLLPPAQTESFVYRSIEFTARLQAETAAEPVREELHPGVYASFIFCWAALFGIFPLTFLRSPFPMFMIAVGAFTGLMYFSVPIVLGRVRPATRAQGSFTEFLRGEFDTLTGPVRGSEALLHVILVPAALSLGAVAIGFIIQASRIAQ